MTSSEEMQGKLKTAQENERKMKNEGYTYTKEDAELLEEVNTYFASFGKKTMEYFNELADKEVEVEITEVEEAELLKAIKACEKSFDDMEMLACTASNVKENENVSLLWAADYFGRPSFYLQSVIYPPFLEWQILQIGIFAKFNSKKLLK